MIITDEAFQQFIREYQQKQLAKFGRTPYVIEDSRDYITCGHCRCVNGVGMVCVGCGRSL